MLMGFHSLKGTGHDHTFALVTGVKERGKQWNWTNNNNNGFCQLYCWSTLKPLKSQWWENDHYLHAQLRMGIHFSKCYLKSKDWVKRYSRWIVVHRAALQWLKCGSAQIRRWHTIMFCLGSDVMDTFFACGNSWREFLRQRLFLDSQRIPSSSETASG